MEMIGIQRERHAVRKLYAAYGSNLNLQQMARRCPTAKMVGATYLVDWQLTFRTCATVKQRSGAITPIGVWDIDKQAEQALDRYEGFPSLYRKEFVSIELNGKQVRVMLYVMNNGRPTMPNHGYLEIVWDGYTDFGLDHSYLEDAMKDTMKRC